MAALPTCQPLTWAAAVQHSALKANSTKKAVHRAPLLVVASADMILVQVRGRDTYNACVCDTAVYVWISVSTCHQCIRKAHW
jgi:hypothetical protein